MKIPDEIAKRLVWTKPKGEDNSIPYVEKILPIMVPCENCDKQVPSNRFVTATLNKLPQPHWKHHCSVCRCYRNPETKEFSICHGKNKSFFMEFYKDKNK